MAPVSRCLIALGLCSVLPPWASGLSAQSKQKPTFRASTQLVEVDVNVTDRDGAFVPDLTLGDFEISDEGKKRPIDIAYVVRAGHVSVAGGGTQSGNGAGAPLPVVPPSGRRVLVFFFDTTHMNFGQLRRAGAAAEQFLTESWHADDIVGVLVGDRMINNRLTGDRAESLAAVRAASLANDQATSLLTGGVADAAAGGDSPTPAGRSAEADAEVAENLKDADKAVVSGPLGPAELTTLNLLERLVANLARVPGRKNIVYFSGGFPLLGALPQTATNAPDELPQLRRIVANAAGSNVHIYSVDAVGLDKGVGASRILTATQPEFANSSAANYAHGISMGKEDLLTDLALDTGGLLFLNQNFYVETLKRIDQDSSNYYVLAFRPDDKAKPKKGDIRSLRVKVHRPHVTVRARKGYVVQ